MLIILLIIMKDKYLIDSVIGFNLKGVKTTVPTENGDRVLVGKTKNTCHPDILGTLKSNNVLYDTKWFTNFNENLLSKIRDYKKINE